MKMVSHGLIAVYKCRLLVKISHQQIAAKLACALYWQNKSCHSL